MRLRDDIQCGMVMAGQDGDSVRQMAGAIEDAGLKPSDVDGMATFTMDTNDEIEVARALGCGGLTFWGRSHYGGGAACATVMQAAMASSERIFKILDAEVNGEEMWRIAGY